MDLAGASNNLVFVYTLAESSDSFGAETTEIREAISASARQERVLKPSTDLEIYNIVKQRLFSSIDAIRPSGGSASLSPVIMLPKNIYKTTKPAG